MYYLIAALAVTVPLLVRAENREAHWQIYFFKPLSTLLIIAVAALALGQDGADRHYTLGVLVGLVLSLGGDVALMFQQRQSAFLAGLVAFLLGHIAYTVTFHLFAAPSAVDLVSAVALLALAIPLYRLLAPGLGSMRLPVIAYFLVISLMVHQSIALLAGDVLGPERALLAVAGAVLFYLSDVVLAADRFWKPWRYNRYSLFLYFGGQLLIALSAHAT